MIPYNIGVNRTKLINVGVDLTLHVPVSELEDFMAVLRLAVDLLSTLRGPLFDDEGQKLT